MDPPAGLSLADAAPVVTGHLQCGVGPLVGLRHIQLATADAGLEDEGVPGKEESVFGGQQKGLDQMLQNFKGDVDGM